jgi:2-polyprenyl-3-methyl-5-hydroxy-6-metoxy-1,4-benzoquinol methylase
MALLQLRSTNPDLSFIIMKNPATGLVMRENRQGILSGWFSKGRTDEYNVWFKDSDTEVSYKAFEDESFEYVNTTRFASAMFVINALGDFFGSTFKKQQEKDVVGFDNELTINILHAIDPKYMTIFQQHFIDFNLEMVEVAPRNWRVTIKTKRTIRDLLNYVNLLAVFNVLKNGTDFFMVEDATVAKYMAAMTAIDAPYFVRYVFKVNLLRSPKLFAKYKPALEASKIYDRLELIHGNTGMQREDTVKAKLGALENQILDIGCGEGNFVRKLAGKLPEGVQYLAVDIDEGCRQEVESLVRRKQFENVQIFANLSDLPSVTEKTDVLMVEVIEHMPMADAEALVREVFKPGRINIGSVTMTTPNKEFNKFYDMHEDHVRHDDHHFELTPDEWNAFLLRTIPVGYMVETYWIGDVVNGIPTTLAAKVTPAPNPAVQTA